METLLRRVWYKWYHCRIKQVFIHIYLWACEEKCRTGDSEHAKEEYGATTIPERTAGNTRPARQPRQNWLAGRHRGTKRRKSFYPFQTFRRLYINTIYFVLYNFNIFSFIILIVFDIAFYQFFLSFFFLFNSRDSRGRVCFPITRLRTLCILHNCFWQFYKI